MNYIGMGLNYSVIDLYVHIGGSLTLTETRS